MSTAEQVIAAHRLKYKRTPARHLADTGVAYAACAAPDCDWSYDYATAGAEVAHAAHVVEALATAGKTIVDLPEPDPDGRWTWTALGRELWNGENGRTILLDGVNMGGPVQLSHEYAERLRDCLSAALAAARVAEGGERGDL
ncbi:hypothetical protein GS489_22950 [Rhodococcus hoagii]|nr:hypothetical protein [Prescottella equi]